MRRTSGCRLRQRAKLHHRSLQGELLAIIETAGLDERQNTAASGFAEEHKAGYQVPRKASRLEEVS
jgi:hypothetical protein